MMRTERFFLGRVLFLRQKRATKPKKITLLFGQNFRFSLHFFTLLQNFANVKFKLSTHSYENSNEYHNTHLFVKVVLFPQPRKRTKQ